MKTTMMVSRMISLLLDLDCILILFVFSAACIGRFSREKPPMSNARFLEIYISGDCDFGRFARTEIISRRSLLVVDRVRNVELTVTVLLWGRLCDFEEFGISSVFVQIYIVGTHLFCGCGGGRI